MMGAAEGKRAALRAGSEAAVPREVLAPSGRIRVQPGRRLPGPLLTRRASRNFLETTPELYPFLTICWRNFEQQVQADTYIHIFMVM